MLLLSSIRCSSPVLNVCVALTARVKKEKNKTKQNTKLLLYMYMEGGGTVLRDRKCCALGRLEIPNRWRGGTGTVYVPGLIPFFSSRVLPHARRRLFAIPSHGAGARGHVAVSSTVNHLSSQDAALLLLGFPGDAGFPQTVVAKWIDN